MLAELRLLRPWTAEEHDLADAIAGRARRAIPTATDCSFFDGLVAYLGVLTVLDAPAAGAAVARLQAVAGPAGWPVQPSDDARILAAATTNDLTLGTAGVLLGALWGGRHGLPGSHGLADHAVRVLLAEAEQEVVGLTWRMVPPRYFQGPQGEMPNLCHGVTGVATALALASRQLQQPDLLAAAVGGAEHLLSLAHSLDPALAVPRTVRAVPREDDSPTYGWCHGSAGTSLLFLALHRAGVTQIAERSPLSWHRRCPRQEPLRFAVRLADTLLKRAVNHGPRTYWQFTEHRAAEPLLPPGVGWMEGAAGIATYLFRVARVLRDGGAAAPVARMDNWWAVEA